jgi:hypothetical protein
MFSKYLNDLFRFSGIKMVDDVEFVEILIMDKEITKPGVNTLREPFPAIIRRGKRYL